MKTVSLTLYAVAISAAFAFPRGVEKKDLATGADFATDGEPIIVPAGLVAKAGKPAGTPGGPVKPSGLQPGQERSGSRK